MGDIATSVHVDPNGLTGVLYHQTVVVKFDSKTITLDSGGWRTVTTKKRMNQAARQFNLGFNVYQSKGTWYVDLDIGDRFMKAMRFTDGMIMARDARRAAC